MKWKSLFAAALAAAVAWPAMAQDATGGGTPSLSFSFANGKVQDGTVERVTVVPAGNHTSLGIESVPVEKWIDLDDEAVTTTNKAISATDVVAIGDTHANFTLPAPVYVAYSAANGWSYAGANTRSFLRTYLDDGGTGASITVRNVPFTKYDVIVYLATDNANAKFRPVTINGTRYAWTQFGTTENPWSNWSTENTGTLIVNADANATFGRSQQDVANLGQNAIRVDGLETQTLTIQGSTGIQNNDTGRIERCGIAAIQIIQASDGAIRDTATYQPSISVNMKGYANTIVGTSGTSGLLPVPNAYWNELPTSGTSESGVGFMDDSGLATSLAIDATYSEAQWRFSSAGRPTLGDMANGYREVTTLDLSAVPYSQYDLILYYASDRDGTSEGTSAKTWAPVKITSGETVSYYTYTADHATGAALKVDETDAADWGTTASCKDTEQSVAYGGAVMLIEGLSGDIALEMLKNDNNRGALYGFQIVCTGDVLTDKEPIAGIISVNARGTMDTITSNTTTRNGTSGLDAFAVANANWNELTKEKETETLTGLKDAFGVATTADVTAYLGGKWSLSEGGSMNLIDERTERLGAMGDGYNDAGDAVNPIELSLRDIPYETYDLVLYLCTDNTEQKWAPVEVISNGVSSYYTYTGEETDGAATKSVSKPASWGTTNDIENTENSGTLGHDVMLIKGLSGDIEVDMGTHNPTRGGLAGFQIIGRGKEIVPPTPEPVEEVPSINVNFASGRISGTDHDHPLKGETGYGLYPVPGGEWDNVLYSQRGNAVTLTTNGFVVSEPVTLTFQATGAWEYPGTNNLLVNVLDDAANNNQEWCTDIDIAQVPFTEYSAIVYLYADAGVGFRPVEVNGKYYTYKDGALTKVEGYDQAHAFGNTTTREPVVGVNAVRVDELTGAFSLRTFKNGRSGSESLNTYARGNLAGFQLICTGEVIPTVDPAKKGVISLNFGSNHRTVPENETAYGLVPVAGNKWQNFSGESGTDVAITRAENTDLAGAPTVTYSASTTYWTSANNAHPFLQGYLDDGATSDGYGATISVANLPYKAYDVIVYAGYSDNGEDNIHPYEIDGTFYRWDDTKRTTVATTDTSAAASWGSLSATPVYGKNALRVRGRLASTLSPLTVKGLPRLNQDAERGGIAALQIVERKLITENFANALAALAEDTPVYIRPTAQIAGDLTLPADAVLDLRYVAWDNPVVSGTLTLGANTMIRLPGGRVKYAIAEALAGATDSVQVFVHDDIMDSVGQLADGVTISSGGTITRPATYEWTGAGTDTNWTTAANWSSGVVPKADSEVTIPLTDGAIKIITLTEGAVAGSLTITGPDSGTATLAINGTGALTVSGQMSTSGKVSVTQSADITVNGAATAAEGNVPEGYYAKGSFDVNGATYTLSAGTLTVGNLESCAFLVGNGATFKVGGGEEAATLSFPRTGVLYPIPSVDSRIIVAANGTLSSQSVLDTPSNRYKWELAGGTLALATEAATRIRVFGGIEVSGDSTLSFVAQTANIIAMGENPSALTGEGNLALSGAGTFSFGTSLSVTSGAPLTGYTGELSVPSGLTLVLGEARPALTVAEGATVNITPTAEEQATGVVSFGTSMKAVPNYVTFTVSGVDAVTPAVDNGTLTLSWAASTATLSTTGNWSASAWKVGETTGQAAPESGVVVLDGTAGDGITVTLDMAIPAAITTINVRGDVTLVATKQQATLPTCINVEDGATLGVDANFAKAKGSAWPATWDIPANTTLRVTGEGFDFGGITVDRNQYIQVYADLVVTATGAEGTPALIEPANNLWCRGKVTVSGSDVTLKRLYWLDDEVDGLTVTGDNVTIEGLRRVDGSDGLTLSGNNVTITGDVNGFAFENNDATITSSGTGNVLDGVTDWPNTFTVTGGDLTIDSCATLKGATVSEGATLKLAADWAARQTLHIAAANNDTTNTVLDMSAVAAENRPTLARWGSTVYRLPKTIVVTPSAEEESANVITLALEAPSDGYPGSALQEGAVADVRSSTQTWVPVIEKSAENALTITNVPAPNGLSGLDDAVALTLRQAAAKEGITNGNYTVRLRTKGGQTTIASPDADTLNGVLGCFTGLTATANSEKTTLTYAYDFGIVGIARNAGNNGWVVTAQVQGAPGAAAGFAEGNVYTLTVNGAPAADASATVGENGTVTFTVPDASVAGETCTLGVKVARPAAQP